MEKLTKYTNTAHVLKTNELVDKVNLLESEGGKIQKIKVNNQDLPISSSDKSVNIDLTDYAKDKDIFLYVGDSNHVPQEKMRENMVIIDPNEASAGYNIPIDSELSTISTNSVQNKVITTRINQLQADITDINKKVPTPTLQDTNKFLKGDGSWGVPPKTVYNEATEKEAGLLSVTDKIKLNGIEVNANNYTHPANHPATIITGLANVAKTGNYEDLTNKPVYATQAEAEAGAVNNKVMTPLRTKQATEKFCLPKISGAAAHNSIYRGKYLGSSVTTAQWNAIKAGTFDDLYIGDYWTIGGVDYVIAAFDYYLNTGNTSCIKHHVTIVPRKTLYNHVMNDTNIVTGAYIGSKMYKSGLNQAKTTITNAFGSSHILTIRQLYTTSTNPDYGFGTGFAWQDDSIFLMNEVNIYGCYPFTEFYRTTQWGSDKYSIDNSQYPIFAFDKTMIHTRQAYWLRNVAYSTNFANVTGNGCCNNTTASTSLGVRPAFNIYQS